MNISITRDWPTIGRRIGYAASFVMVAGVAARVSYGHIRDVALFGHQPEEVALLLPLAVDGMMLIATLAMAEDKAAGRSPRGWARFGFWFGAAISTAANVAATVVQHGWDPLSIAVAAAAPLLLLLAIEIVARPGKPKGIPVHNPPAVPEPTAPATLVPQPPAAVELPAAAPVSPGYGPVQAPTVATVEAVVEDDPAAIAFRAAQVELRKTSKLPALNKAE